MGKTRRCANSTFLVCALCVPTRLSTSLEAGARGALLGWRVALETALPVMQGRICLEQVAESQQNTAWRAQEILGGDLQ